LSWNLRRKDFVIWNEENIKPKLLELSLAPNISPKPAPCESRFARVVSSPERQRTRPEASRLCGLWTIRRTLVPIRRVQHVDTETSLLQTFFDLATVTFHTAAGATEIPALKRAEAERVRSRVAELARTRDDV